MKAWLVEWLHRKGLARCVNTVHSSSGHNGSATFDGRGPEWLALGMCLWSLKSRRIDRGSVRVADHWVLDKRKHRWKFSLRWVQ